MTGSSLYIPLFFIVLDGVGNELCVLDLIKVIVQVLDTDLRLCLT